MSKDAFELQNLVSNPTFGKKLDYMRQLYDDFVATWKDEAVPYNGYLNTLYCLIGIFLGKTKSTL